MSPAKKGAAGPDNVLSRSVIEIIPKGSLAEALQSGKKLRLKLGLDPMDREMMIEERRRFRRCHGLRLLGEADDIREHYGGHAGDRLGRALTLAYQAVHQVFGYVGLEPAQAHNHRIERLCCLGDFNEQARRKPRHPIQRQVAYLLSRRRQPTEWCA